MKSYFKKIGQLITDEDGPTAVEYAVMLALIVVVCIASIQAIGTRANTQFQRISTTLGN